MSEVVVEPVKEHQGTKNLAPRFKPGQSGNPLGKQGYRKADLVRILHGKLTRQKGRCTQEEVAQALLEAACDVDHRHFMDAQRTVWELVGALGKGSASNSSVPAINLVLATSGEAVTALMASRTPMDAQIIESSAVPHIALGSQVVE